MLGRAGTASRSRPPGHRPGWPAAVMALRLPRPWIDTVGWPLTEIGRGGQDAVLQPAVLHRGPLARRPTGAVLVEETDHPVQIQEATGDRLDVLNTHRRPAPQAATASTTRASPETRSGRNRQMSGSTRRSHSSAEISLADPPCRCHLLPSGPRRASPLGRSTERASSSHRLRRCSGVRSLVLGRTGGHTGPPHQPASGPSHS